MFLSYLEDEIYTLIDFKVPIIWIRKTQIPLNKSNIQTFHSPKLKRKFGKLFCSDKQI